MEFLKGVACAGCLIVAIVGVCYIMFVKNWMDNT